MKVWRLHSKRVMSPENDDCRVEWNSVPSVHKVRGYPSTSCLRRGRFWEGSDRLHCPLCAGTLETFMWYGREEEYQWEREALCEVEICVGGQGGQLVEKGGHGCAIRRHLWRLVLIVFENPLSLLRKSRRANAFFECFTVKIWSLSTLHSSFYFVLFMVQAINEGLS